MKKALAILTIILLHAATAQAQTASTENNPSTNSAESEASEAPTAETAATEAEQESIESAEAAVEVSEVDFPDKGWIVSAGGTVTLTEGNSSTRVFGAQLDADRESKAFFLGIEGSARYGKTRLVSIVPDPRGETAAVREGRPGGSFEENINDWLLSGKYGRYLTQGRSHYAYGLGAMESDRFRGFWVRSQGQVGYGYHMSGKRLSAKVEAGVDFTEDHQVIGSVRSRLSVAANAVLEYLVSDTLTIRESLSHVRTLETNTVDVGFLEDYRLRSNTTLQVKLINDFDLRTSVTFEHASVPAPGAHKTDVKFTTSILYSIL